MKTLVSAGTWRGRGGATERPRPARLRSRATALLLVLLLGGALLADGPAGGNAPSRVLREAWVLHRLTGELERAERLYAVVYEHSQGTPDLRARAAIGLGLLWRDRGDDDGARSWLQRALDEPGADHRWRQNARDLLEVIPREPSPQEEPLARLRVQVSALERDVGNLQGHLGDMRGELRSKEGVIETLQRYITATRQRRDQRAEVQQSRASMMLESIVEQERQAEKVQRFLVLQGLEKTRQLYSKGRFLTALNEARKVLEVDPRNRDAQELRNLCIQVLAVATGQRTLPSPPAVRGMEFAGAKKVTILGMKAHLAKAREQYAQGETAQAIASCQRVLEDYAYCPFSLDEEEIFTVVRPAERLLRQCFENTGNSEEAMRLQGRTAELIRNLRQGAEELLDQKAALQEVETSISRLMSEDPQQGLQYASQELARLRDEGLEAIQAKDKRRASIVAIDILTWLDFFPQLDPEGELEREVKRQLHALGVPIPRRMRSDPGQ